jgi:predicted AAA+ superfamily ATPase
MIKRGRLGTCIKSGLAGNPGVVLLGPRQCGKTTLARQVAGEQGAAFFDLEDPDDAAALDQPMMALSPLRGLVVLDEVQRRPEIFECLRVLMDRADHPARFLLLGSASPHLVRGVTESLAGRVAFVDMQGFSLAELEPADQERLWIRGGFPRSYLAAGRTASMAWRKDFIRTFIEKDFASLGLGLTPASLGRLWRMTAHYHGQTLNASEIGRSLGESYKTVQRHLEMLEGAFMIRTLRPWFENAGKRLVKSPKVFVRDSGLLHGLLGLSDRRELLGHPKLGASWEGFALEQILSRLPRMEAWFWGTQGGAELDLFVQPRGRRIGFEFKVGDAPKLTKSMSVAVADLRLEELIVVKPAGRDFAMAPKIRAMSLGAAMEYGNSLVSGGS